MDVKGYKTIVAFGVVTVAGVFGHHLPPEVIQDYASDIIQLVGLLGMGLRMITNSPVGQTEIKKFEDAGVPQEVIDALLAKLPQQADLVSLLAAVNELKNSLEKPLAVLNPPVVNTPDPTTTDPNTPVNKM